MSPVKLVLVAALLFGFAIAGGAEAATQSRESRLELAQRVEQRAAATSFPALEAFGESALGHPGREGLNRLYHVMWITLNQGDFERAEFWNNRLAAAALER
nr:hybrid sensor histidine kinase/response regulator [Brevundimonas sp.]